MDLFRGLAICSALIKVVWTKKLKQKVDEEILLLATVMNFNLLKAIKEERLTQRDFARLVGDHESIVSRIVTGVWVADEKRKILYSKTLGRKVQELFQEREKSDAHQD